MGAEELDNLYRDAWDLYSVYFSNYSPNCIQFEDDYASILRKGTRSGIPFVIQPSHDVFISLVLWHSLIERYSEIGKYENLIPRLRLYLRSSRELLF